MLQDAHKVKARRFSEFVLTFNIIQHDSLMIQHHQPSSIVQHVLFASQPARCNGWPFGPRPAAVGGCDGEGEHQCAVDVPSSIACGGSSAQGPSHRSCSRFAIGCCSVGLGTACALYTDLWRCKRRGGCWDRRCWMGVVGWESFGEPPPGMPTQDASLFSTLLSPHASIPPAPTTEKLVFAVSDSEFFFCFKT